MFVGIASYDVTLYTIVMASWIRSVPKKYNDEDTYVCIKNLAMEKCCNSFLKSQVMLFIFTLQVNSCVQSQTMKNLDQILLAARLVYSCCRMYPQGRESYGVAEDPVVFMARLFNKDLWLSPESTPQG